MIDLTNVALFDDLTTVNYDGGYFDLHNDYYCKNIRWLSANRAVSFLFNPRDPSSDKCPLVLQFEEASVPVFTVNFERSADSSTLETFYRGRYVLDGDLLDCTPDGERYFYINFWEEDVFEILSKKVSLILWSEELGK